MTEIETELAELELVAEEVTPRPSSPRPSTPHLGPEKLLPPPSDGPKQERPSWVHGMALLLSLLLAVLGAAFPLVAFWFATAIWLYGSTAELLQLTGGLAPGMFESARMWAAIVNAAVLGWCLLRLIRYGRDPRRRMWAPLAWLWVAYVFAAWILVLIDLIGPWNIDDPLTTFLLVGGTMLIGPGLTLLMLVVVLRAIQAAWQAGRTHAGYLRVVAGSTLVGLSSLSLTAVGLIGAGTGYVGGLQSDFGAEDDIDKMVTLDHDWYVSASGSLNGSTNGFGFASAEPTMVDCYRELTQFGFVGDPPYIRAVFRAQRRGLAEHDALDLAWDTLTDVCARYVNAEIDDLRAYYGRSVENALNKRYRRRLRSDEVVDTIRRSWHRDGGSWGPEPERRRRVRKVLGLLSEDDRRVLELSIVHGLSHREVGRRMGKSEAAAAQAFRRARKRFVDLCEALECRSDG